MNPMGCTGLALVGTLMLLTEPLVAVNQVASAATQGLCLYLPALLRGYHPLTPTTPPNPLLQKAHIVVPLWRL